MPTRRIGVLHLFSDYVRGSVVFDKDGMIRGINLYKIEPGPRLTGRWTTLPGPGVQQTETLTFLKKLDAERDDD